MSILLNDLNTKFVQVIPDNLKLNMDKDICLYYMIAIQLVN